MTLGRFHSVSHSTTIYEASTTYHRLWGSCSWQNNPESQPRGLTFLIGRKTPWVNKMDRMADSASAMEEMRQEGERGRPRAQVLSSWYFKSIKLPTCLAFSEFSDFFCLWWFPLIESLYRTFEGPYPLLGNWHILFSFEFCWSPRRVKLPTRQGLHPKLLSLTLLQHCTQLY